MRGEHRIRGCSSIKGLTVTYFHLHEAQCVNVGTALSLPHPGKADLASGEREEGQKLRSSRGIHAPIETVTPLRAKGASPIATLKE